MNLHNDNFNINNNSLNLVFSGKGLLDNSNILNDYLKNGIGFQLLSNNSNYKEIAILDTSNINSNNYSTLRIAIERSQISLKSITSNNIIRPIIINSNITITSNIGIGKINPNYNIDAISNINTDEYFIKGVNISNIFTSSNNLRNSIQEINNSVNLWTKSGSTIIFTNSNVGINKVNPIYNLDVSGNINFTGNLTNNGVLYKSFSGNYGDLNNRPNITWDLNANNTYNTNTGGNVGINTTLPAYRLDVRGDINFSGNIRKNGVIYSGDWSTISGKPNLAVVATSGSYLDLKDTPSFTSGGGLSGLVIKWDDITGKPSFASVATTGSYSNLSDRPIIFDGRYVSLTGIPTFPFTTSTTHIFNNNTGNVGINQVSPAYRLDVSGDINFTGNLRKGGVIYGGIWDNITGRPSFASVATTGHWDDILGKPQLFNGNYSSLTNRPTNFQADWNTTVINKPQYFLSDWNTTIANKPALFGGYYSNLMEIPKFHPFAFTGKWSDIEGKPVLSAVAETGKFYDLVGIPPLFSSNYNDLVGRPTLFNGDYNNLINKPYVAFNFISSTNNINTLNSGNMGVGISVPTDKLDVNGNINIASGFFYKRNGINLTNTTATFSDIRIKTNINDIEDISGLEKILKIEPKTYNYIDIEERGENNVIGFIAQQIREIIPEAITIGEEFIPNIYKYYEVISINTIYIDDGNINKINIKDVLKIKTNSRILITKVIEKINKIIKVDVEIDIKSRCFIYGVKINDFHFIDKTYIYTLNVCATQELYKRLEEQKKEIEDLKKEINEIKEKII